MVLLLLPAPAVHGGGAKVTNHGLQNNGGKLLHFELSAMPLLLLLLLVLSHSRDGYKEGGRAQKHLREMQSGGKNENN